MKVRKNSGEVYIQVPDDFSLEGTATWTRRHAAKAGFENAFNGTYEHGWLDSLHGNPMWHPKAKRGRDSRE
jgi:hypothetical protein